MQRLRASRSCCGFIKFAKHHAVPSFHLSALISLTLWVCMHTCIYTYLPIVIEKDLFALLLCLSYITFLFLSVYGLKCTYVFPFNSGSVSASNQNYKQKMLKACTLCMHAFLLLLELQLQCFFLLLTPTEWEIWDKVWKTEMNRIVIYFSTSWYLASGCITLVEDFYSKVFRRKEKTFLPAFGAARFNAVQCKFSQLNLLQLDCLLFFFHLGHATKV